MIRSLVNQTKFQKIAKVYLSSFDSITLIRDLTLREQKEAMNETNFYDFG